MDIEDMRQDNEAFVNFSSLKPGTVFTCTKNSYNGGSNQLFLKINNDFSHNTFGLSDNKMYRTYDDEELIPLETVLIIKNEQNKV